MSEAGAPPAPGSHRLSLLAPRSALGWDLLALAGAALMVHLVLPARPDWVAHVLAGGALVIIVDALLPTRFDRVAVVAGAWMVLGLAILAELEFSGPFDPADVAFTVAGALLVTGFHPDPEARREASSDSSQAPRWQMLAWGASLFAFALYFRYGIRRGP